MGWLAGIGVEAAKGVVWHDHLELRSEVWFFFIVAAVQMHRNRLLRRLMYIP
jgi:hypothetical protein